MFTTATGNPAALVQRVSADGAQDWGPLTGPIDLGPETDEVYLVLFGTGLRGRSGLAAVAANMGGVEAPVTFAGALSEFDGLDQVNVRLARSLIGRGQVDLALSADGWDANTVMVTIR